MKRNPNSTRSKKWIERNTLNNPSCERYVLGLCSKYFEFSTYQICEFGSEKTLRINYGGTPYIIQLDTDGICLQVLEHSNTEKERYHTLNKRFTGDSCWFECLSWIKEKY